MKKIILNPLSILLIIISSCSKTEIKPYKSNALSNTVPGLYDFESKYDSIMKAGAYGLIDIMKNLPQKQLINSAISKQFDGDDNTLFRSVDTMFNQNNLNLTSIMTNSCNNNGFGGFAYLIPEVINGFKYFEDTAYAQIYIPFYESYNVNALHSVCFNLDDDESLPGFVLVNGNIVNTNITENFASEHPVYVVSANEIVNNKGQLPSKQSFSLNSRGTKQLTLYATKFKVSSKNEKWGNGRGEIENIFVHYQVSTLTNIYSNTGFCKKIKKTDINKWISPDDRIEIFFGDGFWWESGKSSWILLYEKDKRRKYQKHIKPKGTNWDIYYTSKEDQYGNLYPPRVKYSGNTGAEIEEQLIGDNYINLKSTWWEEL